MVAGIAAYRRAPQRIIQPLAGRAKQQDDIVQVVRRGTNTWGSKSAIVLRDVTYWLSIDKIATTDLGGQVNGVMAVFTDITDAVLKEKALQEGEMRYRAYMSHSNDGIWCYELLTPSIFI